MGTKRKVATCLYAGCDAEPEKKGNCAKHYMRHARAVAAGKTSWQELEDLGRVLPSSRGPSTDYDDVLRRDRERAKAKAEAK